jgi:hypothetical protein
MQELFSEEGMAGFDLAQYVYAFFLLTSASLLMDRATKRGDSWQRGICFSGVGSILHLDPLAWNSWL